MSGPTESIRIVNVVASSDIGQECQLATLADDLRRAEYNPDRFPGIICRRQRPKATALIYRTGIVVCTGAKSIPYVTTAVERLFDELRELGIAVRKSPDIVVQNIVSSVTLDRQLDLNALAIGLGMEQIEYEPELFPGLVYRLDESAVVVLVFGNGNLVITGAKRVTDIERGVTVIQERITELVGR